MGAAAQFFSSRGSDRILTIHDDRDPSGCRTCAGAHVTERFSKVTMSAGHGEGAAGEEHSRSSDQSVLNRPCNTGVAAAHVSHRGKTAVDGMAQHLGGV